jgi:hypothetical protein
MKIKTKRLAHTVVIGLSVLQGLIFLPNTTYAGIGKNVPSFDDQYLLSSAGFTSLFTNISLENGITWISLNTTWIPTNSFTETELEMK